MYCNKCGKELPNDARFCHACGKKIENTQFNKDVTIEMIDSLIEKLQKENLPKREEKPKIGMLWYELLIYFVLFLSAGLNLFAGISLFFGWHYGSAKAVVYESLPDLVIWDILFGGLACFLAVYVLIVRSALKNMKASAPGLLYSIYAISGLLEIGYYLIVVSVVNASEETQLSYSTWLTGQASLWTIIIVSGAMIAINYIYFAKRRELFIN